MLYEGKKSYGISRQKVLIVYQGKMSLWYIKAKGPCSISRQKVPMVYQGKRSV